MQGTGGEPWPGEARWRRQVGERGSRMTVGGLLALRQNEVRVEPGGAVGFAEGPFGRTV